MFLGSTWEDLRDERRAVRDAVLNVQANHDFPLVVLGMEDFGPQPQPPLDVCLAKVLSTHVYVGITGDCYGSRPPGHTESYTELEFQAASGAGLPCFVFMKQPRPDLEDSVRRFRERVSAGRVVQSFASPTDLKAAFLSSMPGQLRRIHEQLRSWWPVYPGALHHGAWLDKLASVLIASPSVPLRFLLHRAGLMDGDRTADIGTLEQARLFILSLIMKASTPQQSKEHLIRFVQALLAEPRVSARHEALNEVIWEISGEAERASRLLFGSYASEAERIEAIREYLAAHRERLVDTFAVPGGVLRAVVQTHKAPTPLVVDFVVISLTTLGYQLDLVKLETSDVDAFDFEGLLIREQQLHDFAQSLHEDPTFLRILEMLLDTALRESGDQGRLRAATANPLGATAFRVHSHLLAGRREDLAASFRREDYEAKLAARSGLKTQCVSYDRFIDVIRAEEDDL